MTSKAARISLVFICIGLLSLVLLMGGVKLWKMGHENKPDQEMDTTRKLAEGMDPAELAEKLDQSMIHIPAGEFIQGSVFLSDRKAASDEMPQRKVHLDTFEIDTYEVTNAQYQRYVLTNGAQPPRYWIGNDYPSGTADYPVVGISWEEARVYCEWAGKRLPTEAEWEKACRGPQGNTYPWGKDWKPEYANLGLEQADNWPLRIDEGWQLLMATRSPEIQPSLKPVGSYSADASVYGVFDMAGNASEWVEDWYNWSGYADLPQRNPVSEGPPWNHVIRGGTWFDRAGQEVYASDLSRCAKRNSSHSADDPRVGFRCAKSVP